MAKTESGPRPARELTSHDPATAPGSSGARSAPQPPDVKESRSGKATSPKSRPSEVPQTSPQRRDRSNSPAARAANPERSGRPARPAPPKTRPRARPPARPPTPASAEIQDYDVYDDPLEEQIFQDESLGGEYFDHCDEYDENPFAAPKERSSPGRAAAQRGKRGNSRTAGTGLLIQGWSTVTVFLTILFMVLMATVFNATGTPPGGGILTPAAYGTAAIILLASIAILVGECMCISIPESSGAKGLIIGAIACLSLQIAVAVLQRMLTPGAVVFGIVILGAFAGIAHWVLFELFLRSVSRFVGREDLVRQATIVLVGFPSCILLMVLVTLAGPALRVIGGVLLGILLLIVVIGIGITIIVLAVMHVALLFRVGTALRE